MTREVFERGHAAAVLLYDPARDRVVLIEQFRPGAYAAGFEPWLIQIVAGIIEEGETTESVVCREAEEAAGCKGPAPHPIRTRSHERRVGQACVTPSDILGSPSQYKHHQ